MHVCIYIYMYMKFTFLIVNLNFYVNGSIPISYED